MITTLIIIIVCLFLQLPLEINLPCSRRCGIGDCIRIIDYVTGKIEKLAKYKFLFRLELFSI